MRKNLTLTDKRTYSFKFTFNLEEIVYYLFKKLNFKPKMKYQMEQNCSGQVSRIEKENAKKMKSNYHLWYQVIVFLEY